MTEPFSHEAEQAVLGAVMLKPSAYWLIADKVTADDFWHEWHRELFGTLARLVTEQKACDCVTVGEMLERAGRIDSVGGTGYLIEVANNTPGTANIGAYAEIVASKAEVRRVRAAGRLIATTDDDDDGTAAGKASVMLSAAARADVASLQDMREVLKAFHAGLCARVESEHALTGVPTGIDGLDAMTGGFQPGDLIVLAARPSMGKTALALQSARYAAEGGHGVLIFSLEMPSEALTARMIGSLAHVDGAALRSPRELDQEAWPRISAATARLASLPIIFDESGGISIDALEARARQASAKTKIGLVVIDYLQLMRTPKADNQNIAVGLITGRLKAMAKNLRVPVIILSQLNRQCEARGDKRPYPFDLRDSGSIEQDADLILMLYRDEVYNSESAHKGFTELLVRKHRNGATGMVPCRSDLRFGLFHSVDALPEIEQDKPRSGFSRYRVKGAGEA